MDKAKLSGKEKIERRIPYFFKLNLLPVILSVILLILLFFLYQMFIFDKFYPLTFIGNINVSFLNYQDAFRVTSANFEKRAQNRLTFTLDNKSFEIDLATSSASI